MNIENIKKMTLDACKGCKGMVSKGVRNNNGTLESCECALEFQRFRSYAEANIEMEYWRFTEDDYDKAFVKANTKNFKDIEFFMNNAIDCIMNNVQLIFYGKNGLGKTVVAYVLMKKLIDMKFKCSYVTASRLADMTFTDKDSIEDLRDKEFIVIDELDKFTGKNSESLMRLSNLLCDTLMRSASIIFITNEPIEQLRLLGYSNSFISRLEGLDILEFTGKNLRKQNATKFSELKCRQ